MYIYNGSGTMITGPITAAENNPNGTWGSSIYSGESLIIELKLPAVSRDNIELHIDNIAHGYKKMFEKTFGQSGTCNINVLCALGNGWENERNAVALVLNASGNEHCSGTLIRNTCNTNASYLLTANHCYTSSNAGSVSSWRFIFQYWSPVCTPNQDGSRTVLFNGSTLRANNATSDFALLELNQVPPTNSGINYAGWSRSTIAPTFETGIHHPSGDVMKISRDLDPAVKSDWLITTGNSHWRVNWNNGVTEGGSSGSALFDQNHRVIGQLHGGYSSCTSSDLRDWYGAFDQSWTGGGTSATRLSDWLDPTNTGLVTTNTTNVANLAAAVRNLSISGAGLFCTGSSTYTLSGFGTGSTITWSTSDATVGSIPTPSNGTSVNVTRANAGNIVLTAIVQQCGYTYTATKNIHIGGYDSGDYPITGSSSGSCGSTVYFSTNQLPYATSYTWFYPSGWSANGYTTYSLALTIPSRTSGNYQVSVRVANACDAGGSDVSSKFFYVSCNGFAPAYTISPNPATNEVTVTASETKAKSTTASTITEVTIFDQQGRLKKSQKFGKVLKATVNLSGLSTGIYFIEIGDGINKNRQQLSILK